MSLKTRSIWMGAVLHVSVALSMSFRVWPKQSTTERFTSFSTPARTGR